MADSTLSNFNVYHFLTKWRDDGETGSILITTKPKTKLEASLKDAFEAFEQQETSDIPSSPAMRYGVIGQYIGFYCPFDYFSKKNIIERKALIITCLTNYIHIKQPTQLMLNFDNYSCPLKDLIENIWPPFTMEIFSGGDAEKDAKEYANSNMQLDDLNKHLNVNNDESKEEESKGMNQQTNVTKVTFNEYIDASTLVNSYEIIIISSSLIFTFAVTLASSFSDPQIFDSDVYLYLFNIFTTLSISSSFYTLAIMSLVVFNVNRHLGYKSAENASKYILNTSKPRLYAKYCFLLCCLFFIMALCVLFLEKLSVGGAIINICILMFGIACIVYAKIKFGL